MGYRTECGGSKPLVRMGFSPSVVSELSDWGGGSKPPPYELNLIVLMGLGPSASWQNCREWSCAVPFGLIAEGVKPLPYERSWEGH